MENIISSIIESELGFSPYNVVYSCSSGLILSITFYSDDNMKEFCKFASITNLCDESEFLIFREMNTIILRNYTVRMFNKKLMEIVSKGDDIQKE